MSTGSYSGGGDDEASAPRVLLVVSSTAVPFPVRSTAREVLEDHGYDVVETVLDDAQAQLADLSPAVVAGFELCAVVGGLTVGPQPDVADALRSVLTAPLPGVVDMLRGVQVETGYARAVFESPAAGWLGGALAVTLPAQREVLAESLAELVGAHAEVRGYASEHPSAFEVVPPGAETAADLPEDENRPDATILRMPRPTAPPDSPLV